MSSENRKRGEFGRHLAEITGRSRTLPLRDQRSLQPFTAEELRRSTKGFEAATKAEAERRYHAADYMEANDIESMTVHEILRLPGV